jgi:hypothetical protein
MILPEMVPENAIEYDQLPEGYLEKIVCQAVAMGSESTDKHNNLIRMILLVYQATESDRWAIADALIRLIYQESEEYAETLTSKLQKLSAEFSNGPAESAKGGSK